MAIIMTLWIGNDAVLKISGQRQLKEFRKLNYSVHELFYFQNVSMLLSSGLAL